MQHLEAELDALETKYQILNQSYTSLDSTHAQLKREVKLLNSELASVKSSREGSVTGTEAQLQSTSSTQYFDPFASDGFFGQDWSGDEFLKHNT